MFKVIKENKIIGVSEQEPVLLDKYEVQEDTERSVSDYEQYQGEYLLKSDIPAPSEEEQKAKRAQAYLIEVDPITAHIQRLRDNLQSTEYSSKIQKLMIERDAKVAEIQERYPYPEDIESIIASGD